MSKCGICSDMEQLDELSLGNENEPNRQGTKRKVLEVAFFGFSSLGAFYGDIGTSPLMF